MSVAVHSSVNHPFESSANVKIVVPSSSGIVIYSNNDKYYYM